VSVISFEFFQADVSSSPPIAHQDEYGTAAYKMVECDDLLGGIATQHREVQNRESTKFKSYFPGKKLKYLKGGVASGFTHVEPTVADPFLYQVKGTERGMSLTQVDLKKSSLNAGDSFILYGDDSTVFVWNGADANVDEKARAAALAESMCTKGTAVILEDNDESTEAFWKYIDNDGDIGPADNADDDVKEFAPTLYKFVGDNALQIAKAEQTATRWGAPSAATLSKSLLTDDDILLLDAGWDIFVWIGSGTDKSEKLNVVAKADKYVRTGGIRTKFLPIHLVKSGFEESDFLQHFSD
jgi:gelsolin